MINPSLEKKHGPSKEGEQLRSVIECSKAKDILNWKPQTSFIDGLKKTYAYFKRSKKKIL